MHRECPTAADAKAMTDALLPVVAHALLDLSLNRAPDEVAKVLLFLASDCASYITGTCVEITGGKFCVQNPANAWS